MWHLGMWFNGGLGSCLTVALRDVKGLLQPKQVCDSPQVSTEKASMPCVAFGVTL